MSAPDFPQRVNAAVRRVFAAGLSVRHVAVKASDWADTMPRVPCVPAPRSEHTVVWAFDARRNRLVPFIVEPPSE